MMNKKSRTYNSIVNLSVNVLYQIFVLIVSYLIRRIFIEILGVNYLGISSLFSNILEILALAELGISSAISFSMYKEITENNKEKLQALNTYYKSLYNKIALIVLSVGLALLPFLKYLIKIEEDIPNIQIFYLMYLFNTVFSYLFVYKTTIVIADQNGYKLKIIGSVIEVVKYILQIYVLIEFKDYFLFLLVQIVLTIMSNIIKNCVSTKWYPFIKEKKELDDKDKKDLWTSIKAMFYYKFGGVILNNTDNILTSILVSTTAVGYYSNYTMIYNKLISCINLFFNSLLPSIGNLNASVDNEKKYNLFKLISLLSYWTFSIACIGAFFIAEDVVVAMSGAHDFLLGKNILIITVINFYLLGVLNPNYIFRQTTGLFKMAKYSMLICALLNIILSVILGNFYGLFGILLATIISRLVTNIWYEPYILYKKIFGQNVFKYYKEQLIRITLLVLLIIGMIPILSIVNISNLYIKILIKSIICFIIPNIIFFLYYRKTDEVTYIKEKIVNIISSTKEKLQKRTLKGDE